MFGPVCMETITPNEWQSKPLTANGNEDTIDNDDFLSAVLWFLESLYENDTAIPKIVYRYRVSQKNVVSWKNSHNYPQTHPKCKSRGVLENSGYLLPNGHWDFQNWRRNDWENEAWSCQPPSKNGQNSLPLCPLLHMLVEGKIKVVLYPWLGVSSSKTLMP